MVEKLTVRMHGTPAGILEKEESRYSFVYFPNYQGPPISLRLPVETRTFQFDSFPSFFDGLLPEGPQLEGLLKSQKIDRNDFMTQLLTVGADLVGAVTVEAYSD